MLALKKIGNAAAAVLLVMLALMQGAYASEIDLKVPSLDVGYNIWGYAITGSQILMYGIGICVLGMVFGFYEFVRIKKMPAHESMLKISNLIYETCKTYMKQQAKLLLLLEIFIAACIFYYFFYLNAAALGNVYRRFADLRRVDYDDYHSAVCAERKRRRLLYRFCHRRILGCCRFAYLRRYLYQDWRYWC